MDIRFPRDAFVQEAQNQGRSQLFIEECLLYADGLQYKNLPVIFSTKHLSLLLELEYKELNNIILNSYRYYKTFSIAKKRGGERQIKCPNHILKSLQRWILNNILINVRVSSACKGFRKGESIITNADTHLGCQAILRVDLENFFDTITENQVRKSFIRIGYSTNLSVDLAKLCVTSRLDSTTGEYVSSLPQGAPTSPMLANIVAYRLDKRLSSLANKLGVRYSRYADDLVFSGNTTQLPKIELLKKIITEEGLKINNQKTLLRREGQKRMVTGIIVSGDKLRVPKKYKKDIWKHLHYALLYGPDGHTSRIKVNPATFKEWLLGRIMYVRSVEKDAAEDMLKVFNEISWGF
ncbi:reverse transcriptase family protein [Paenibacillus sp. XY044]|uniref:reverse transcriptase family protein n=1 Tax=Paenibacillus sp. XY044 TaxID=2026089 RepID=UPI000B991B34|nr:reverse transcriptase family protein [Paenibacillus sp. XY044]OZB93678.1 hypothetical protein CJP46_22065 [Paenibacillus sp. XY044]